MAIPVEPEDIFVEFLRSKLTDPRGRHTNTTETFSGDDNQKTFTLSNSGVRCVNSVSVGGGPDQLKYIDFTFDLKDDSTPGTVTFGTAPPTGVDNVEVDYDYGSSSWIYPFMPDLDRIRTSYPLISVTKITDSGVMPYMSDDNSWDTVRLQVDVQLVRGDELIYGGEALVGQALLNALARDLRKAVKSQWRGTLQYANMHKPTLLNDFTHPYDEEHKLFRRMLEYRMEGENIGDEDY